MFGLLISWVFWLLVSALVIWIVGRLNLGLTVKSYSAAIIAALVISIVAAVVFWFLGLFGFTGGGSGFWGALINLIVAAVVLLLADRFVPGMEVKGFTGAIVAAIAIGVVDWIVLWFLSLLHII